MNVTTNEKVSYSDCTVRLNIAGGLILIALGILHGMFLAADRDFSVLDEMSDHLREGVTAGIAAKWIELAHAHWGVMGLVNIVIGLVLPICGAGKRYGCWTGLIAFIGGIFVPIGFVCWIFHPALIYTQLVGTLMLLAAVLMTAWAVVRRVPS